MKHIHVACAIINHNGKVLAAQRSASMNMSLKWEFPGGKIEPGEAPEECLRRELIEEMGINVKVGEALPRHTHKYPTFNVTLYPFVCSVESDEVTLHEHAAVVWLPPEKLQTLDWAEADCPVIENYCKTLKRILV